MLEAPVVPKMAGLGPSAGPRRPFEFSKNGHFFAFPQFTAEPSRLRRKTINPKMFLSTIPRRKVASEAACNLRSEKSDFF
jgi:hypothetical protein